MSGLVCGNAGHGRAVCHHDSNYDWIPRREWPGSWTDCFRADISGSEYGDHRIRTLGCLCLHG